MLPDAPEHRTAPCLLCRGQNTGSPCSRAPLEISWLISFFGVNIWDFCSVLRVPGSCLAPALLLEFEHKNTLFRGLSGSVG